MFKLFKEAPKSVKASFVLISISLFISILVWELKASNFEFGSHSRTNVALSGLLIAVIIFIINCMILKKKNWARITLTVVTVFSTFFYVLKNNSMSGAEFLLPSNILTLLQQLAFVTGIFYLYSAESKNWFKPV